MTDPAKIETRISIAVKGLDQLKVYTRLDKNATEWVVDLETAPLGNGQQTLPRKPDTKALT